MELVETWSSLYGLRFAPVTMLQVLFSAGTVFLLLALQATSNLRIAHGSLTRALAQVELCDRHLREVGRTWAAAAKTGDILRAVLEEKLRPIIARRLGPKRLEDFTPAGTPELSSAPFPPATDAPYAGSLSLADAPAYPADWNPNPHTELGGEDWTRMPLHFFVQSQNQSDAAGGFVPALYPGPLAGQTGNTFPELDTSGFLPTSEYGMGVPQTWEQDLFDIDRSRHF